MTTAVVLFTRDLRVRDNPALAAARRADQVVPLFVFDRTMLTHTSHRHPNRFGFLCQSLIDLDSSLRDRGASLVVRRGDWVQEVLQVAYEARASVVHVARDVSAYGQKRLARLIEDAARGGVDVVAHDSIAVLAPTTFAKPYLVFTPYYKQWLKAEWPKLASLPRTLNMLKRFESEPIPDQSPPGEWVGGETEALARLKAWTPKGLARYADTHDNPGADETSRLSPYLHFGCVSPLEVASRLVKREGGAPFVRQLCWRDFYTQLLWWRPETSTTDVRPNAAPQWVDDPDALAAWKEGRTGYPLVDAGMRQLRAEGWMHNRVRMVTASFLTKDLRIDWRVGAAHFMELLVDGDVANNQLNWQWVAGTGTDANPHRVLNPTVQAKRFDPQAVYIRRWVEEYGTDAYPAPIVDHAEAIAAWKATRGA